MTISRAPFSLARMTRPNRGQLPSQIHAVHHHNFAPGQLGDGIRRGRNAQHIEQHIDAVVAVNAGAMVHVVGADQSTGQLLEEVALLVRAPRGIQKRQRGRSMLIADFLQPPGDEAKRFLPTDLNEIITLLQQWSVEPVR